MDTPPMAKRRKPSTVQSSLTTNGPSPDTTSLTRDLESLSNFERLPAELLHMVIAYVPEAVFDLRLASQSLRARANEFARRLVTIPLVNEISIFAQDVNGINVRIALAVLKSKSALFELRHKLRDHPALGYNLVKREKANKNTYELEFKLDSFDERKWKSLIDCVGTRIYKVTLLEYMQGRELLTIAKLVERFNFTRLTLQVHVLSDEAVHNMLSIIRTYNIELLALWVGESTISDRGKMLLELASRLRNLQINQLMVPGVGLTEKYLLGLVDFNWPPIIAKMLTEKLEKLYINSAYKGYLTTDCFDNLKVNLPKLGKKICFVSTCPPVFYYNNPSITLYDHWAGVVRSYNEYPYEYTLKIKHESRMNEGFEYLNQ